MHTEPQNVAPENEIEANQNVQEITEETPNTTPQFIEEEAILVKEQEIKELQEKLLRAQADFQNYKQRSEKDKIELRLFANEEFAKGLLQSLDTFLHAMRHVPEELKENTWVTGVLQFDKQLTKFLEDRGIKKMEITPNETLFDPNTHEAIAQGEGQSGTVLEVYQEGYMYGEKLLRPAKVKVAA